MPAGLPAEFGLNYSGSGTGQYGTSSGTATWVSGGSGDRNALVVYNGGVTESDYQLAGGVFVRGPGDTYIPPPPLFFWQSGTHVYAADWIYARMAGNLSSGVLAYRRGDGYFEFGTFNPGYTALSSQGGVNWKSNTPYYLECGTSANIRTFRLLEGAAQTAIWSYTDSFAITPLGPGNRHGGFGSLLRNGGQVYGSPVRALMVRDNQPAPVVGTAARVYRSLSTGVAHSGQPAYLASNFMNTVDYITSDIIYSPASNNALTVTKKGNYQVSMRIGGSSSAVVSPGFARNGAGMRYGGGAASTAGPSGSWTIPLEANDYIQPLVWAPTAATLSGEASGTFSFLEILKVG